MAKYVPVTDYETALGYNRAGLLYWRGHRGGTWHSTSKERGYYDDPIRPGQERWSDDIKGGIEHAILVKDDDDGECSG